MADPQAAVPFPSAAGSTLRRLVQEAFDFALVLDADGRVTAVVHGTASPDTRALTCLGGPLQEAVSVESRHKVGELLGANCLAGDGEFRWRHLNLLTEDGGSLPVLAKTRNDLETLKKSLAS